MKKFRFLTLVLAFILAFSIIAPISAYAAEGSTSGPNKGRTLPENGKITFTPNSSVESGAKFDIYQILVLESYVDTDTTKRYSYKYSDTWASFFAEANAEAGTEAGKGLTYMFVNDNGYVEWIKGKDESDLTMQALAADMLKYITDNNIGATNTATYDGANPIVWNGLPLGYYLVVSDAGLLCNLTTTNNEVTIKEKNTANIKKEIADTVGAHAGLYGGYANAEIGDMLSFKISVDVYAGAQNYVIHDDMSKGLTYIGITSVKVKDGANLTEGTDYTVALGACSETPTGTRSGCEFHVTITDNYLDAVSTALNQQEGAYQTIEITYTAQLNDEAVISGGVNYNEAKLDFGTNHSTDWEMVTAFTYAFDLVKYDGETKAFLDGAEFLLYSDEDCTKPIPVAKATDGSYRVLANGAVTGENIVVTGGKVTVQGLDPEQTYYLKEIVAPAGYNILSKPAKVTFASGITPDSRSIYIYANNTNNPKTANTWADGEGGVAVANHGGAKLPETGGTGTVIFITVGSLIALAAFVILVARKRSSGYAI